MLSKLSVPVRGTSTIRTIRTYSKSNKFFVYSTSVWLGPHNDCTLLRCPQRMFTVEKHFNSNKISAYENVHKVIVKRFGSPQPYTPYKLSRNDVQFKRKGRDMPLEAIYKSFSMRRIRRAATSSPGERQCNLLTALHGPTGGGKSFFLDEIAALSKDDIANFCRDPQIASVLQNSIAVTISYNSDSEFYTPVDSMPEIGLALRILYYYYNLPHKIAWPRFADFCLNTFKITDITFAYEVIQYSLEKRTPILLLVDELMKGAGPDSNYDELRVSTILTSIGSALNAYADLNVVVSTLNTHPFYKVRIRSGRPITWIVLDPLTTKESLSLFPEKQLNKYPSLQQCISDCNGHPRSLEALSRLCSELNWQLPTKASDLLELLVEYIPEQTSMVDPPTELVIASLLGDPVELDSYAFTDSNGTHTYRESIYQGLLLNNLKSDKEKIITPRLSPLLLLMWTKENLLHPLRISIKTLLGLERRFNWMSYEDFHANWEVLWQELHKGQTLTLAEYYKIKDANNPLNVKYYSPEVADAKITAEPLQSQFLQDFFPNKAKDTQESDKNLSLNDMHSSVVIPAEGNPAFDIAILKKNLMLAIECKYSSPNAINTFSAKTIDQKNQLLHEKLEPHIKSYGITMNDVFHIFCVYRDIPKSFQISTRNCIVLDREHLNFLYSPTLANRPHFINSEIE